jgi:hypothetical protein
MVVGVECVDFFDRLERFEARTQVIGSVGIALLLGEKFVVRCFDFA